VALSIHNPKAEKLAREVAAKSGESITQSIITALEDRLERIEGKRAVTNLAAELMKIGERCSRLPDLDQRTPEQILGYDPTGVPE
jgi:antitoxin VapB